MPNFRGSLKTEGSKGARTLCSRHPARQKAAFYMFWRALVGTRTRGRNTKEVFSLRGSLEILIGVSLFFHRLWDSPELGGAGLGVGGVCRWL